MEDGGYDRGYVEGMLVMIRQDCSDYFVLGTEESHTVREFAEAAFKEVKIELEWICNCLNEVGLFNDETMVKVSNEFYKSLEGSNYWADYSKAKKKLKWEPKTKFRDLVRIMV